MPFIRFIILKRCTFLILSISLNREIINPYSYCAKKGLVYIIIITPSGYYPFFCLECTKANIYLLYNVRLVFINKYIFLYYYTRFYTSYNFLVPDLSCYRVLGLIYCYKVKG